MRNIGFVASAFIAVVLAGGLAVLAKALPDIRRYRRMRKM